MPDAGKSNTEKQEQTEPGQSSPEKEELKTRRNSCPLLQPRPRR